MSACSYARVSSASQKSSLEVQEAAIAAYLKKYKLSLREKVSIIGSGRSNNIAEYMASIKVMNFVVYDVSRFSRNVDEATRALKIAFKKNIRVHFIVEELILTRRNYRVDSPEYILFQNLIKGAKEESDAISRRTKAAKSYLRSKGKYTGGPVPYGLQVDDDKSLVEHPEEMLVVEFIDLCLLDGRRTDDELNAALQKLNPVKADTIHFKRGRKWTGASDEPLTMKEVLEHLKFYGIHKRGAAFTMASLKTVQRKADLLALVEGTPSEGSIKEEVLDKDDGSTDETYSPPPSTEEASSTEGESSDVEMLMEDFEEMSL